MRAFGLGQKVCLLLSVLLLGGDVEASTSEAAEIPESGQTVTTTVDAGGLANFSYVSTDGNPSTVELLFIPDETQIGMHVIHFAATDDFTPPCTTDIDLTIIVDESIPTERTSWSELKTLYR